MKSKRTIYFLLPFLIVVFMLVGCKGVRTENTERFSAQYFDLFDTVTVFTAYTKDQKKFDEYNSLMYQEMLRYHQLYDIYNDYDGINNIKTINDNAGIAPVEVDDRILDLLEEAIRLHDATDGAVNVAMGSVLSIWHEYRQQGINDPEHAKVPPAELLEAAADHMDIRQVIIDREHSTVYLADPEMRLDVGAVAKGYATEMVSRTLAGEGLTSAMLNVGGNVRAIGERGDKNAWMVGIQNPDLTGGETYLYTVAVRDLALVTSGTYQRFYIVDGVTYHHIIHPGLLMPWNEYASISILCEDSGLADALSTALFNMDRTEGMALIDSMDGVEALWLYPDGTMECSTGFKEYLN